MVDHWKDRRRPVWLQAQHRRIERTMPGLMDWFLTKQSLLCFPGKSRDWSLHARVRACMRVCAHTRYQSMKDMHLSSLAKTMGDPAHVRLHWLKAGFVSPLAKSKGKPIHAH